MSKQPEGEGVPPIQPPQNPILPGMEDGTNKKPIYQGFEERFGPILRETFRERLLRQGKKKEVPMFADNDDFETLDDDMEIVDDGLRSKIHFSQRIKDIMGKPWEEHAVYVKLMNDKTVAVATPSDRLDSLWPESEGQSIMYYDNRYFLVRFMRKEDATHALTRCPWVLLDSYLHIQPWECNFNAQANKIESMVVWIRLPGIPVDYYKKILRRFGRLLRRVVHVDQ
ncbi:OLC1v1034065C1 [Oldenlandia corymbosa var. corymbosa]|uniref:OLC1v1034065C1 n=1 Tax=Oldenlandia corymbosa var. corymbosa TaxID=529605 RepID=A0AAV1CQF2_OLDCO|nr:OLC1v1034065C1 [Oldenlandia corymbosa var. corymbosa]